MVRQSKQKLVSSFCSQPKKISKRGQIPLKLSYSCIPNIKTRIKVRNKDILRYTPLKNVKRCNCQKKKENCLMNGACLKENLVFYAAHRSQ